jgi:hypothetical protein
MNVIRYLVADNDEFVRSGVCAFLKKCIEKEFGAAHGETSESIEDTLRRINDGGQPFDLITLDMEFVLYDVTGGLRILEKLSEEQLRTVIVYSGNLDEIVTETGRRMSEELGLRFHLTSDRMVDTFQGTAGLWVACSKLLTNTIGSRK